MPDDDEEDLPGFGGVYRPSNLNLYGYAGQNPVKYTDPDGNSLAFGAILGAGLDVAGQAIAIKIGAQKEFDYRSVVVSAVAGAAGIGLATKIARIEKLTKASRVLLEVAADATVSATSKGAKGENVSPESVALDVAVGQAGGKIAGKLARGNAEKSLENKLLGKAADRAKRIASNPKVGRQAARQRQAQAARTAQRNFLIEKEVKGAAVGSGTAQGAKDTYLKSNEGQKND